MSDLTHYGLDVKRLKHRETQRERKDNVQAYLVQRLDDDPADVGTAYVEWRGAGTDNPRIACMCCDIVRPADPACAHIEAVRIHLGFRPAP